MHHVLDQGHTGGNDRSTLLGVCPMSEEIITATIRIAATEALFPMFVATPRQVDGNRGYTGWSQRELVEFVDAVCEREGYDGEYLVARDHGGPYQSTRNRGDSDVPLEEAMGFAMETFRDDVEAGFDVLHVDATEDPRTEEPLDLDEIARRTVELIDEIEGFRNREGHPPIAYEVGTEEIAGGLTDPDSFGRFLDRLEGRLSPDVFDRTVFAVGQVGTTMRIDMENQFDPEKAAQLVERADERDIFLKVHFTDWLPTEQLERFPELGVGAANVGPEFAAALVESLVELQERERELLAGDDATEPSGFTETLEAAAIRDAPWEKYAPEGVDREQFGRENARNIALCVGRYVLGDPEVEAARERLYENVARRSSTDPNEVVVEGVSEAIARYARAFSVEE